MRCGSREGADQGQRPGFAPKLTLHEVEEESDGLSERKSRGELHTSNADGAKRGVVVVEAVKEKWKL